MKSIQYNTRPRLIVISQAIGDKRIMKFISSGWDLFKSLGVAQTVCHWRVSFFRQQARLSFFGVLWAQDTLRDFYLAVTWPCSFLTLRHVNWNSFIIIIFIIIIIIVQAGRFAQHTVPEEPLPL